jgi:hypothetical protein
MWLHCPWLVETPRNSQRNMGAQTVGFIGYEDDRRNFGSAPSARLASLAKREGVTFRALVERGLRRVVTETKPAAPFKLRCASFKGKGLQADARGASWSRLRDLAYEGRGG